MSIETSGSNRSPSSDMADLQTEYTKKKKKYAQDQEAELSDLKDHYNQRKEEVRDQGEAAINHIRKTQADDVAMVQETRHRNNDRTAAQLAALDNDYRKKFNDIQNQRESQLDSIRETGQEKVDGVQTQQDQQLQRLRETGSKEITQTKDRFNRDLHRTEDSTKTQLMNLKESSEKQVRTELDQEKLKEDKLNDSLKKEYDSVDSHGKHRIQERHDVQENQYERQESEYDKRFHSQAAQWHDKEKETVEESQNRIAHSKKAYDQQLKEQNSRFKSIYGKNDSANHEALKIQENNYLKEQIEMKKKFFKATEHYAGKEDDPFYKLQDRGSRMRENSDFYIVEAYVPEHEKDNILVSIHDNKAAITGRRTFKDDVKEDDYRLSTNSYQTFREEFNFDKPVITQGMTRERNGDYMTFWVPKLNSFEQVPRLNRKA